MRTFLAEQALTLDHIDDIVLTHLDHDHWNIGWLRAMPAHARFRIWRRHRARAERQGVLTRRTEVFDEAFELASGTRVTFTTAAHDAEGVAIFRFDVPPAPGTATGTTLGYATDVGRLTAEVVDHLRGVDVLAIESNYCPRMQRESDRPDLLKRRIMGGAGHLSNQESAEAVRLISPRRLVVLLHLSRQCNSPELAMLEHQHASCRVIAARHDRATPMVRL